eukprot:TRINITY_DN2664_c0_g4_i2.p1 TRINITY_DN2664_c0_g4~~TRINITY_DN2664_c0_g4_i2.p1  ORF type:complete len:217 (-),score=50.92 TRINITY_DN2664_c0_g4_i2:322-921(-)
MNQMHSAEEEDCGACDGIKDQLKRILHTPKDGGKKQPQKNTQTSSSVAPMTTTSSSTPTPAPNSSSQATKAEASTPTPSSNMESPPTVAGLGKSTWTLLHTMAAYYPEKPTDERKQKTNQFLYLLSQLYPCNYCAEDFQEYIQDHPPKLETRQMFSLWSCELHNHVNEKLGKETFPCESFDQRWRRQKKPPQAKTEDKA